MEEEDFDTSTNKNESNNDLVANLDEANEKSNPIQQVLLTDVPSSDNSPRTSIPLNVKTSTTSSTFQSSSGYCSTVTVTSTITVPSTTVLEYL